MNTNVNKKEPCCPEKVEMLIQSEHCTFTDADREWLNQADESFIDKLVSMQSKDEDTSGPITREQAIEVLKDQLSDPDKFMKLLPQDLQEQFQYGMALRDEHKSRLVAHILANIGSEEIYSKDELNAKEISELEKLASAIKPGSDFSGLGAGNVRPLKVNTKSEGGSLLPTGFGNNQEDKEGGDK